MAGSDKNGWGEITTLPRRVIQRIGRDIRHDVRKAKQKGSETIPSAILFAVEKWLGFWAAVIVTALVIGGLGMGLVYVAEWASTVSMLTSNASWAIGQIGALGLLTVLTWGVIIFAIVLVSGFRLALWSKSTFMGLWNQHTPPFTENRTREEPSPWHSTDEDLKTAWEEMTDFLGWGSIIFIIILFVLFLAENIAQKTLNDFLSSSYLTAIGNSLDVAFWVVNFDGLLEAVAPNVSQPQLVLFVLFFVIPGAVMAIGARNLLYITEVHVREHIEIMRDDGLIGWSTFYLVSLFLYSIGICIQILAQWG